MTECGQIACRQGRADRTYDPAAHPCRRREYSRDGASLHQFLLAVGAREDSGGGDFTPDRILQLHILQHHKLDTGHHRGRLHLDVLSSPRSDDPYHHQTCRSTAGYANNAAQSFLPTAKTPKHLAYARAILTEMEPRADAQDLVRDGGFIEIRR